MLLRRRQQHGVDAVIDAALAAALTDAASGKDQYAMSRLDAAGRQMLAEALAASRAELSMRMRAARGHLSRAEVRQALRFVRDPPAKRVRHAEGGANGNMDSSGEVVALPEGHSEPSS